MKTHNNIELNSRQKIQLIKLSRFAFTDLDSFVFNKHGHIIAFDKYAPGLDKVIPKLNMHWLELILFVLPELLCDLDHVEISKKLFIDYITNNVHPVDNLFDIFFDDIL